MSTSLLSPWIIILYFLICSSLRCNFVDCVCTQVMTLSVQINVLLSFSYFCMVSKYLQFRMVVQLNCTVLCSFTCPSNVFLYAIIMWLHINLNTLLSMAKLDIISTVFYFKAAKWVNKCISVIRGGLTLEHMMLCPTLDRRSLYQK